jgi:ATP-binding cassette subfamily B multidrug efflux pump
MKVNVRAGYGRILRFAADHIWSYIIAFFALLVVNLLQIFIPRITGQIVDSISAGDADNSKLLTFAGLIMLLTLIIYGFHFLARIQILGSSNLYDYLTRNQMFRHLEKLSMNFFHRKSVGDIMALSASDLSVIRLSLGRGVMNVLNTLFVLVSSIIVMANTMNLRLTLIIFVPLPLLTVIVSRFGNVIHRRSRKVQESFADLMRKSQENISGIRIIKAFTQEEAEIRNFKDLNEKNYRINMSLVRARGLFSPLIKLVASISYLLLIFFGGPMVIRGTISLGDFIAFNSYIGMLIHPITFVGMIINEMQQASASLDRIEELFAEKPEISDSLEAAGEWDGPERFRGEIEFRDVVFSYNENTEPVLNDVSFHIKPGSTVAFLGKIGSGKTTINELILRFYDTGKRGCIFIDGYDIQDIPLGILRRNIGYVPQDNLLFSDTIRRNIAFTPEEVPGDKVEEAAKVSCIYDSIMEFPDKFETELGERGVNLSGGQKQRISIARAIALDPSILLLDDCLSAVDTGTEELILKELKRAVRDRTCIMIAHRISTIKDADEIFVLDNGHIAESGTHEQLLQENGFYRRMYDMQLLEETIAQKEDE